MDAIISYVEDLTRDPDTTEKLRAKADSVCQNNKTVLHTELAMHVWKYRKSVINSKRAC